MKKHLLFVQKGFLMFFKICTGSWKTYIFFSSSNDCYFFQLSPIAFQQRRICGDVICFIDTYNWFNLQIAYNSSHKLHKPSLWVMVIRQFNFFLDFFNQTAVINLMCALSSAKFNGFSKHYFSVACHELILTRIK